MTVAAKPLSLHKANDGDASKIKVLIDLRPALDGYFGIPSQVRLLFAGLAELDGVYISGLLQMSTRPIRGGVAKGVTLSESARHHRYAQVVMSLKGRGTPNWRIYAANWIADRLLWVKIAWFALTGLGRIELKKFEASSFRDFVWQHLFARAVSSSQRETVLGCDYQVCSTPWRWMHAAGIDFAWLFGKPRYARIDTSDMDVAFFAT